MASACVFRAAHSAVVQMREAPADVAAAAAAMLLSWQGVFFQMPALLLWKLAEAPMAWRADASFAMPPTRGNESVRRSSDSQARDTHEGLAAPGTRRRASP